MKKQKALVPPTGEFLLYQTEDGRTRIQCRFADETIWLTQAQISELFQTTPQNVTLHLKAIFADGELVEGATCKDYLQVRQEDVDNFTDGRDSLPDMPVSFATEKRLFSPRRVKTWQAGEKG